jgi:hypothetical protein
MTENSGEEIVVKKYQSVCMADVEMHCRRRDWGGWVLRGTCLSYPAYPNGSHYGFDLTRCIVSGDARPHHADRHQRGGQRINVSPGWSVHLPTSSIRKHTYAVAGPTSGWHQARVHKGCRRLLFEGMQGIDDHLRDRGVDVSSDHPRSPAAFRLSGM